MKLLEELRKKETCVFVEIRGRENVLLEGYCRIELYSETKIILSSEFDRIAVHGSGLNIRHLSSERMAVDGRINGVEFL
jgi:sporulation protein YqfC